MSAVARRRFNRRIGECVRRVGKRGQHILRQRDHHRPGTAGGRDGKGAGDEFGNSRRIVDFHHPFGQVAEEALVINLLPGLAFLVSASHLANEQDHRRGILHRDMDACRGVGSAGAARDEADAGLAGEPALAIRHHRRAPFLAADDGADPARIVQRVEHSQEGLAGHAIDAVDPVGLERFDDQFPAGLHPPDFSSSARISAVCSPRRGEGRS